MKQVLCLVSFFILASPSSQSATGTVVAVFDIEDTLEQLRYSSASSRKPSQPPSSKSIASATDSRPVLAVFNIEDTREGKAKLKPKKLRSLTDYLANKLGVGGKFEVVPRASVRKAIAAKKKESYKGCYDESCQIEIGKEIAAQKSLATKIDQMGGECLVTATLYDLRKGATENSASYRGPCGHSELLTAIEQIAFKLRGEKPSQASKKGIRFDTTALPTVPTLEMPSDSDSASSGVDFGNVDVDSMELLDSAIQADKDKNLPIKDKIAQWQKVKKKAPKYRKQATAKIVAWKQYQRKKLQISKIQKKRAAKMMKDWKKLSRLLKLKMVSAEDKLAWAEAFYDAYREEAKTNPFVKDTSVRSFIKAQDEKIGQAAEAKRKVEEAKKKAEKEKREAEVRRQLANKVRENLHWVHSKPAGIDFLKTEVTVAQYRACVEAGQCKAPPKTLKDHFGSRHKCNWALPGRDNHPVNCIAAKDGVGFCRWVGGRIPTRQEWAAETYNGKTQKYAWGNKNPSCDLLNYEQNRRSGCGTFSTAQVCSRPKGNSVSGLCDMMGNIWDLSGTSNGVHFSANGGCYETPGGDTNASSYIVRSSTQAYVPLGFRCVR